MQFEYLIEKPKVRGLSLDGGGVRGLIQATLLAKSGVDLSELDFIAGTSVGSGIACMIASRHSPDQLPDILEEIYNKVFRRRIWRYINPWASLYSGEKLKAVLNKYLLFSYRQLQMPCFVVSVKLPDQEPKVFDNVVEYDDYDWSASEVCAASMSGPILFPPFKRDGKYWIDGGLWQNNPSVAGVWGMMYKMGIPRERIHLFSLGNGRKPRDMSDKVCRWNKLNWGLKFVEIIVNTNIEGSHMGAHLMGLGQYRRFERPEWGPGWGIDSVGKVDEIVTAATAEVDNFRREWDKFMEG